METLLQQINAARTDENPFGYTTVRPFEFLNAGDSRLQTVLQEISKYVHEEIRVNTLEDTEPHSPGPIFLEIDANQFSDTVEMLQLLHDIHEMNDDEIKPTVFKTKEGEFGIHFMINKSLCIHTQYDEAERTRQIVENYRKDHPTE